MDKRYFLTSAQFAELCGITKNALFWYEKKGLVEPNYIGENGYHYYSPERFFDVDLVRTLQWTDQTLEECREYIENRSAEDYLQMMLRQQELLAQKQEKLLRQKNNLDMTIREYLNLRTLYTETPRLITLPERVFLTQKIAGDSPKDVALACKLLFAAWRSCFALYGVSSCALNAWFVPERALREGDFGQPDQCCLKLSKAIPHPACRRVAGGEYAVLFHTGTQETIGESYRTLMDFVERAGAQPGGDAIECDFINYLSARDTALYKRAIFIPIKRKQ